MVAAAVHPSQRRFSCEGCRKIKARCQRIYSNDAKCARCKLLGLDCTTGQQKRVGRPRRTVPTDAEALKHQGNSTDPPHQTTKIRTNTQVENASTFQETSANKEPNHQQDRDVHLPIDASMTALVTSSNEAYFGVPAWPAIDMSFLDSHSLTWDTSHELDETFFLSHDDSTFSSTSSSTPSLNAPSTASSPAESTRPAEKKTLEMPGDRTDFITSSEAMAQLSKINLDLHTRMTAVEANRATLDFNSVIYAKSPLYIGNLTLAQFLLKASQEFIHILTRILRSRATWSMSYIPTLTSESLTLSSQSHFHKLCNPTPSTPFPTSEQSFAPLGLCITSIFTQLLTLSALQLEVLSLRLERIATDPISNLPAFTFSGLPLTGPCAQGIVFCEMVIHSLESMEHALGLGSVGATGLLSKRQKDVLWSEIDGRTGNGLVGGYERMRPCDVRKGFGGVNMLLRQISLDQLSVWN